MKKIRPAGKIFLDLEVLLDELIDDHEFQHGDVLNWIHGHLTIHRPDAIEVYEDDDSSPVFFYGPEEK